MFSMLRLHIASARSRCAREPGWCIPVSNSTTPSPAATAQALQWGTPGHGRGRRRRKTPGSTRSPRPSSCLTTALAGGAADRRSVASATRRRLDYVSQAALQRRPVMPEAESPSKAATKVQEAAANVQQVATRKRRITGSRSKQAEAVARRYFEAIGAHDLDAAVAMWADGGREDVRGQPQVFAPDGVRAFLGGMFEALPDMKVDILSTTTEDDRCVVQWRFTGTFAGPGHLSGVAPTGHPVTLEGLDLITVRDGLIESNDAFTDTMTLPRQIGMMTAVGWC